MDWLWVAVCTWLGMQRPGAMDYCSHLLACKEALYPIAGRRRGVAIWATTYWCIWNHRNDIKFNNVVLDMEQLFYSILRLSWRRLAIASKNRIKCNLFEWFQNPFCVFEYIFL